MVKVSDSVAHVFIVAGVRSFRHVLYIYSDEHKATEKHGTHGMYSYDTNDICMSLDMDSTPTNLRERETAKETRRVRFHPVPCVHEISFRHMLKSYLFLWIRSIGVELNELGIDCYCARGRSHLRIFLNGADVVSAVVNQSGIHVIDMNNCYAVLQGIGICPDEHAFDRLCYTMMQGDFTRATLSYWIECKPSKEESLKYKTTHV